MNFRALIYPLLSYPVFFAGSCTNKEKEYKLDEVEWTITVPQKLVLLEPASIAALNELGNSVIEKQIDTTTDNNSKTLFCIKTDNFNYLSATIAPLTAEYIEEFNSGNKALKSFVYTNMKEQMTGAQIDSFSSREIITNKNFDRFDLSICFPYTPTMNINLYTAQIHQRPFGSLIFQN